VATGGKCFAALGCHPNIGKGDAAYFQLRELCSVKHRVIHLLDLDNSETPASVPNNLLSCASIAIARTLFDTRSSKVVYSGFPLVPFPFYIASN
jgi:hypothetical protein